MEVDLRWPLFLISNLLLIALLRLVNDASAQFGIYLSLPALLVLLPALHTPPRWGLLLCFATALFYAAPYSGNMTPFLVIFGTGYVIFRNFSSQLRRFQRLQLLTSIMVVNTLLMLGQSILLAPDADSSYYTQRVLMDTLFSALLIYPVGSWFLDLQYGLMLFSGSDPRTDAPPQ
ncbi:hypothetical protein [Cerasicoccus fimbriatus]|uniref:hypothetical protein n=1 Tax=Cerasicoccus fimbriatus TaxID=3014554 RepID=UPI0022B552AC|nr:hypothetical protein [Cerasicoccus sp. TK19100]